MSDAGKGREATRKAINSGAILRKEAKSKQVGEQKQEEKEAKQRRRERQRATENIRGYATRERQRATENRRGDATISHPSCVDGCAGIDDVAACARSLLKQKRVEQALAARRQPCEANRAAQGCGRPQRRSARARARPHARERPRKINPQVSRVKS